MINYGGCKHEWLPIINGPETIGIVCIHCEKTVRENMERGVMVDPAGKLLENLTLDQDFYESIRCLYNQNMSARPRKDL